MGQRHRQILTAKIFQPHLQRALIHLNKEKDRYGKNIISTRELLTWRAGLPFVTAVMTDDFLSRNAISSQLGSSCHGNRYGTARQAVRTLHYSPNHTCRVTVPQAKLSRASPP
jgi:hypothetical protein